MKYLVSKIWPLILLLIVSYFVVITRIVDGFPYDLAEAYAIFATYVLVIGVLCQPLGKLVRPHYNGRGWFACHKWEDGGKIYDRLFKVSKFKDSAVNAQKIFGGDVTPRTMPRDPQVMSAIIDETCKSELVHWLLILISPAMLVLIHSWLKWPLWALYIIANFRDILIQRFNRPRFVRLYNRLASKGE